MANSFLIFLVGFVVVYLVWYKKSHSFRWFSKHATFVMEVSIFGIFLIPYWAIFHPCDVMNLVLSAHIVMPVSKVIGLKWEIRGQEHLREQKACIIVSNHQSALDILGQFHMWPIMKRCTVIAKRELFWVWPFGLAAWLSGLIFIDRKHPEKAKQQMFDCTEDLKKTKTKLWIFPEGTRHNTGEIHDFKKGAFHVAVQSQLPIMPVVYSSYKSFLSDKKKVLDPGHIIVEALPSIPTEGLGPEDVGDLMDKVRNMMIETFKANTKEVESTPEFLARVAKLTPENDLLGLKDIVKLANGNGCAGEDEISLKRRKNVKDTVKVPQ